MHLQQSMHRASLEIQGLARENTTFPLFTSQGAEWRIDVGRRFSFAMDKAFLPEGVGTK